MTTFAQSPTESLYRTFFFHQDGTIKNGIIFRKHLDLGRYRVYNHCDWFLHFRYTATVETVPNHGSGCGRGVGAWNRDSVVRTDKSQERDSGS
jgi:hypothetical protein